MITLKQLKPALNFIKKAHRPILSKVAILGNTLLLTDLETTIEILDNFGLAAGLHDINTLGLVKPTYENELDYPGHNFSFEIDSVYSFSFSQKDIESFLPFCSKDEIRLNLNGVAIANDHLVATNGHILKYVSLGENKSEFNYIMPATSLKILNGLLKKYKIKDEFTVHLNEETMIVRNEKFNFKAKLIQREYPKWSAIIPKEYKHEFTVNNWINVRELKPLFNRKNAIEIRLGQGQAVATVRGHDETYIIGQCPNLLEYSISFNAKLFNSCIAKNKGEITIKYNNNLSPVLVNNNICMPLKL